MENVEITEEMAKKIEKIDHIREVIVPIFAKYGIHRLGIFGSYALGIETISSNVDIWCERGNVTTFQPLMDLEKEVKEALQLPINIVFSDADLSPHNLQLVSQTFIDFTEEQYKN